LAELLEEMGTVVLIDGVHEVIILKDGFWFKAGLSDGYRDRSSRNGSRLPQF
jgi:hypothetical protein